MSAIIQTHDLRKTFRRTQAIDGLNLTVPQGQVTAFLGPNGAGKTTTIKCLLNLHRPDSGKAEILGCDSRKLGPEQFLHIGYVSESMELPLWMTVAQFLNYCRPLYPQWDQALEKKLMRQFDLSGDVKLKHLSRGMRMKAALLSSLAYRPKLLVLDEPFTGLDPLVRDEFIQGLLELTEDEGWTVFVSSHDIEEVQRLADRVAILNHGRLALEESTEHLLQRFRKVSVALEDRSFPNQFPTGWIQPEQAGRTLRFTADHYQDESTLAQEVKAALPGVHQFESYAMSLREIYLTLARSYRLSVSME